MPFTKLSTFFLTGFLISYPALANEKPPEGGGGAPEVSKDQREFVEKSSKLTSLGNRIEDAEKRFQELVHAKAATKSVEGKQALIKEMVTVANQRNKDVEAFNKVRAELLYRYPYQGETLNRRYQTQNKRSVEEMESAGGLDELLTRTKKQIERKFAPFDDPEKKPAPRAKMARPDEEKPPRLRLEK